MGNVRKRKRREAMEPPVNKKVSAKLIAWAEIHDERMALVRKEKLAEDALRAELAEAGLTAYRDPGTQLAVTSERPRSSAERPKPPARKSTSRPVRERRRRSVVAEVADPDPAREPGSMSRAAAQALQSASWAAAAGHPARGRRALTEAVLLLLVAVRGKLVYDIFDSAARRRQRRAGGIPAR